MFEQKRDASAVCWAVQFALPSQQLEIKMESMAFGARSFEAELRVGMEAGPKETV